MGTVINAESRFLARRVRAEQERAAGQVLCVDADTMIFVGNLAELLNEDAEISEAEIFGADWKGD